ncbi:hypothetical protein [Vibrio cholerae]|uniref:hypothetical protein n=1 Tax=Vibrio cholerae TaxID=666 RepID=UPI00208161B0|nr:hypothetical protein VCSRO187_3366 [Vibrio cholerae]
MIKTLTYSLHNQSSSPPECEFTSIMNNAGQDNIEFNESNSDLPQEENEENEENAIFSSLNHIDLNACIHQAPVNRSIDDIVVMPKRVTSKPRSLANFDPRTSCETNIPNANKNATKTQHSSVKNSPEKYLYSETAQSSQVGNLSNREFKTVNDRMNIKGHIFNSASFDGKSNKFCNLPEVKNAPTKTQHSSMKNSPEKYLSSETTQSLQVGNLSNRELKTVNDRMNIKGHIFNSTSFDGKSNIICNLTEVKNAPTKTQHSSMKNSPEKYLSSETTQSSQVGNLSNRELKTVNDRMNIKEHIFNSASSEIRTKDFQIENIPKSTYQSTKTCILMPSHMSFSLAPNTLHLPTLNVQYGSLNYVSSTYWQYPRINTYKVYFSKRNFIFEFENDTLTSLFEGHNERS